MPRHRTGYVVVLLCLSIGSAAAQRAKLSTPRLDTPQSATSSQLPGNSVSHIATGGNTIWIGTGKGLARSSDGGRSWQSFNGLPQFARPSIFAVALRGNTIWCSTGYSKDVDGADVQTGTGYTFSLDNGSTWTSLPQTLDGRTDSIVQYGINTVRFLPIVVPEQNVTFDISLTDSTVWIASWSSGLRKSASNGATWQRIVLPSGRLNSISPRDTLVNYKIDPRLDNNLLVFSVLALDNGNIWAGSAGGINKSTDGGSSWVRFTSQNQLNHISGDWVIALAAQQRGGSTRIWATSWPGDGQNQFYGVNYTDDGGLNWHNVLSGVKAYDFAVRDSAVYVATDQGLYRTDDGGTSWNTSGSIVDVVTGDRLGSNSFFAVGTIGDTVYGGSSDGLAKTIDNAAHPFGQSWNVLRAYRPVNGPSRTYAYPNPFSPKSEGIRIHYGTDGAPVSVTLEVFDFGMNRVRTVLKDAPRSGAREFDELWNGRDDTGNIVPNGVYFYRVKACDCDPAWGKVMVLK